MSERLNEFTQQRHRLLSVAYSIIGDRNEAEDVVQEAWLRLHREPEAIDDVTGWLVVTTSRIALDVLRSARSRRENYVGPWLPEPVVEPAPEDGPADEVTRSESVSMAMLVVLETLSPAERTAFVLHDVFGLPFGEIAEAVGRNHATVRRLAARARTHVRRRAPRFDTDAAQRRDVVRAFSAACRGADLDALLRVLDPDVVLRSDGGGVVTAARNPVLGADRVGRFLVGVTRKRPDHDRLSVLVNGDPGLVTVRGREVSSVIAPTVGGGLVTSVDIVLEPRKLARTRAWMEEGEQECSNG